MPTRWNTPVVEADPYHYEVTDEGPREGVRMAFCDEDIEMFRQGYKCIDCLEPLDTAFPEVCPVCEFPIRESQAAMFADRFAGKRKVGSRINEDEELDRLERQRFDRDKIERANARIWVPGSARPAS